MSESTPVRRSGRLQEPTFGATEGTQRIVNKATRGQGKREARKAVTAVSGATEIRKNKRAKRKTQGGGKEAEEEEAEDEKKLKMKMKENSPTLLTKRLRLSSDGSSKT